jgi:cytochrome c
MGLTNSAAHVACAAVASILCSGPLAAQDAVDLEAAKKQFLTSCGVCHTVEPGAPPRQGPNLATVYGRTAGSLPGYAYSEALKSSGLVWDAATLDPWIENAQAMRPGVNMPYRQADPAKRALIIAYLKSLSPKN